MCLMHAQADEVKAATRRAEERTQRREEIIKRCKKLEKQLRRVPLVLPITVHGYLPVNISYLGHQIHCCESQTQPQCAKICNIVHDSYLRCVCKTYAQVDEIRTKQAAGVPLNQDQRAKVRLLSEILSLLSIYVA